MYNAVDVARRKLNFIYRWIINSWPFNYSRKDPINFSLMIITNGSSGVTKTPQNLNWLILQEVLENWVLALCSALIGINTIDQLLLQWNLGVFFITSSSSRLVQTCCNALAIIDAHNSVTQQFSFLRLFHTCMFIHFGLPVENCLQTHEPIIDSVMNSSRKK